MVDYNVCRWCKWFDTGKCKNETFTAEQIEFYPFYEDGVLSEAIKEGLDSSNVRAAMNHIEQMLANTGLSQRKQHEFLMNFYDEWESIKILLTEQIDEQVSGALNKYDFGAEEGITILDPHSFCCKNFW